MHLLLILSMFINVKIDGLDHLRCRGKGLGRGILLPSISSFASHFLSSPEKLLKHSTNQFFFSFLDVMLEKLFPLPSKVVSSYSDLPPTPWRCPRGWRSLGSTPISPSLTSDTFCSQHAHFLISLLVSILTLANRTGYTYKWRMVIGIVQPLLSTGDFNKVVKFIIFLNQSSGHWVSVLGKYYDDIIHPR